MKSTRYGAKTDVGRVRKHNEDSFFVDPQLGLWLVCDGMGGHESGEVASAIAAETIATRTKEGLPLAEAIAAAHLAILEGVEDGRGRDGMGTTAVGVKFQGGGIYEISWVGDSRAYLFWEGKLIQRSKDHTYVQFLIDSGTLTPEEARRHPQRNAITRALGMPGVEAVQADTVSGQLLRGARILLCSDGLTGEVPDADIARILSEHPDDQQAAEALVRQAVENGGSDNVTVVLVSAPDDAPKRAGGGATLTASTIQKWYTWLGWALMGIMGMGLLASGTFWLLKRFFG